nr:MAG TPA: hypothetical protein [Caudoviricetes sp.]
MVVFSYGVEVWSCRWLQVAHFTFSFLFILEAIFNWLFIFHFFVFVHLRSHLHPLISLFHFFIIWTTRE